ncbi:MAG: hypothetical protein KAI79_02205 [Bacteroidales bacterium]|nr:hypothetical protein [Bacteroidales bacterium]
MNEIVLILIVIFLIAVLVKGGFDKSTPKSFSTNSTKNAGYIDFSGGMPTIHTTVNHDGIIIGTSPVEDGYLTYCGMEK